MARRGSHFMQVVGRLKPGVSAERAQSDMSAIAKRLEQDYPGTNTKVGAEVVPFREQATGDSRIALLVLLAGAACVLLIACANVANLLLARGASRQREMALRAALGAGRMRLIRQMVTDSVLLSVAGGLAGLLIARFGLRLLESLVPVRMGITLSLDGRVLLFSAAVALFTGVFFGLAPAFEASRLDLNEALKQGARTGANRRTGMLRDIFVVAEVALALVLLVGAGLMIQTLVKLRSINLGFKHENALTLRTDLPRTKYREGTRRVQFFDAVLARVRSLPGVEAASYSSNLPLTAIGNTSGIRIEGRPAPAPAPGTESDALYRIGTNEYLKTLGVKLLKGRFF
ncbi:MAG: FtsX-like permease family protein, partial [Bryobacteraceae bacterium]|nr:FtsX-like permease family protein [Bryobacteraceae bacterium]